MLATTPATRAAPISHRARTIPSMSCAIIAYSPDLSLLSASTKKLPIETRLDRARHVLAARILHVDDAAAVLLDDRDVRYGQERSTVDDDLHQIASAIV